MVTEDAAKVKKLLSMEEAKVSISEGARDKLSNIWDIGLKVEDKSVASNKSISIGKPTKNLNNAISKVLGAEINTKNQTITFERVKHINKEHGVGRERFEGQIPVTKETFMLIPDILENFDTVEKGPDTWENDIRKQSVVIGKYYSDGRVVLADAIIDENVLKIKTMWIEKADRGKT